MFIVMCENHFLATKPGFNNLKNMPLGINALNGEL